MNNTHWTDEYNAYIDWSLFQFLQYSDYFEQGLDADEVDSLMFGVWWCYVRAGTDDDD